MGCLMGDGMALGHGIHYISRDGTKAWHLDYFLANGRARGDALARPERDVLLSLLQFCVEGIEHLNAVERYGLLLPTSVSQS